MNPSNNYNQREALKTPHPVILTLLSVTSTPRHMVRLVIFSNTRQCRDMSRSLEGALPYDRRSFSIALPCLFIIGLLTLFIKSGSCLMSFHLKNPPSPPCSPATCWWEFQPLVRVESLEVFGWRVESLRCWDSGSRVYRCLN